MFLVTLHSTSKIAFVIFNPKTLKRSRVTVFDNLNKKGFPELPIEFPLGVAKETKSLVIPLDFLKVV